MASLRWNSRSLALLLPAVCLGWAMPQSARCDEDAVHVVEGVITHVDRAGKEIGVKTGEGVEKTFKTSDHTVVHVAKDVKTGTKDTVFDTAHGISKGTHVMVHYTEDGATDTATKIDNFGKVTLKDTKATVVDMDHGAHTILVKTDAGATETYHVAADASVDAGKGVKDFAEDSGHDIEKGTRVALHYSESAGTKTIHLIEKL